MVLDEDIENSASMYTETSGTVKYDMDGVSASTTTSEQVSRQEVQPEVITSPPRPHPIVTAVSSTPGTPISPSPIFTVHNHAPIVVSSPQQPVVSPARRDDSGKDKEKGSRRLSRSEQDDMEFIQRLLAAPAHPELDEGDRVTAAMASLVFGVRMDTLV